MVFTAVILVMLIAFAIGIPVAYALLLPSVLYLMQQQVPLYVIAQKMANGVESFPLLAVPFFIAAGELMNTGGVTRRLVNLASTMVGHITGGLAHVAIVANMIMAGMSGSAIADAAGTGRVLIPAMAQERYSKAFAAAIVGSAGTIGPIIPPSIAFVLYCFIASTSVGRLFLGGIIPGILMIGTLTPPVGTVMYVILNISKVSMADFVQEVWPMLLALTAVLFIITFYPPLVMVIPNALMGVAR